MQQGDVLGGRFTIERVAGSGGMGTVYRAMDRLTDAPVAIKVLTATASDPSRFESETRILQDLRHPSVVRYVASGQTSAGRPYLAMEWLEGEDLDQRLELGPLEVNEALALVRAAADGLAVAHRRGIVHRDVKPSNIFLVDGKATDPRVLDFGVARFIDPVQARTRTGLVLGTPGFLSPEQARGEKRIDARTDVFALGCVLFACVTGRAPYLADDAVALIGKVLLDAPPRVREVWPEAPEVLDNFVARLMERDPIARPRDGNEVARAIEAMGELPTARRVRPQRPSTLTTSEQRLQCVALIEGDGPPSPDDATLADDSTMLVDLDNPLEALTAQFRGRSLQLHGGMIAVVFEGGGVAIDLATLAARFALAASRVVTRRIGLVTGRGATSTSASIAASTDGRSSLLMRASELLSASTASADRDDPKPPIVVDEATARLLAGRFLLEPFAGAQALVNEVESGERRVLGKATPCVGRDREIAALVATFEECVSEPVARAAILVGAAGIGKSRLLRELERRVEARGEPWARWLGRGDPMSSGAPLDLIAKVIRDAARVTGAESIEGRRQAIEALATRLLPATDAPRVARFLAEIAGAPYEEAEAGPEIAAARRDAVLLGDQARRAVEDLVAAQCAESPLVLVLEDLHWGDLPSVKLVEALLRNLTGSPLFVVATARPELREAFPSLWSERDAQEIRLGAITPKAAERLVRHVLGEGTPREVIDRIVARASGHPLHIEEIVRAALEGDESAIPDTVLAMVQARIEALEPEARRLMRAGSVFGRAFWARGVSALLTGANDLSGSELRWIVELVEREWIMAKPKSRFAGEDELEFRQDIVRDAAYEMLTDSDRVLGHRLAGEWLTRMGETSPLVLARHFELGRDPSRAATEYARAIEAAVDGNDFRAAVELADRAASLGTADAALGRVRAAQAEALVLLGELDDARKRALEATVLLDRSDPAWCRATNAALHACGKLGDVEGLKTRVADLLSLGDDAGVGFVAAGAQAVVHLLVAGEMPLADTLVARLDRVREQAPRDRDVEGHVERAYGVRAVFRDEPVAAMFHAGRSADAFEAAGDLRNACSLRKTQGYYAAECGAIEEGERAIVNAIAVATRLGLSGFVEHAKVDLGTPLIRAGKLDEAEAILGEMAAACAARGDRRLEVYARTGLSWSRRARGDAEGAEREARRAIEVAPSAPTKIAGIAVLAAAVMKANRAHDALSIANEGLTLLAECGGAEEGVGLLKLAHAEALHACGQAADAYTAIAAAKDAVMARAAKIDDAKLKELFLTRIEENAWTLALERDWRPAAAG